MTNEYDAMQGLSQSSQEAKREQLQEQNRAYLEQQLEYSRTKQAAIYNRIRIAATTFAVMLIIFTLYRIWIGV